MNTNSFVTIGLIIIMILSFLLLFSNLYKLFRTTDLGKKDKIRRKSKYFNEAGWSYYLHIAMTKDKEEVIETNFFKLMSLFPKEKGYYSSINDGQLVFSRGNAIRYGLIEFNRKFYLIATENDYFKFMDYIEEYVTQQLKDIK